MPESGPSQGCLTRDELADLAFLFDRFEFAFDPRSLTAREAELEFDERVRILFE